ncbi:Protein fem-1-like CG6966 [Papilio machaon]|uniref:Protein fem-1-like CG6966 n=1 Tax=Papilio machaon TaxID=76193 RepID=A0A194QM84_PAPMA|nr:Protein fem-1-like CG6966 [Papilio machaon]
MLVGAKVGGATPLVIACRNGHYDVAEYLIERCKADIEQPGSGQSIRLHQRPSIDVRKTCESNTNPLQSNHMIIIWSDQVQTILGLNIPTAMRQAADRAVWKQLVDISVKALQDEHEEEEEGEE